MIDTHVRPFLHLAALSPVKEYIGCRALDLGIIHASHAAVIKKIPQTIVWHLAVGSVVPAAHAAIVVAHRIQIIQCRGSVSFRESLRLQQVRSKIKIAKGEDHGCIQLVAGVPRIGKPLEMHHQHLWQAPEIQLLVSLERCVGTTKGDAERTSKHDFETTNKRTLSCSPPGYLHVLFAFGAVPSVVGIKLLTLQESMNAGQQIQGLGWLAGGFLRLIDRPVSCWICPL